LAARTGTQRIATSTSGKQNRYADTKLKSEALFNTVRKKRIIVTKIQVRFTHLVSLNVDNEDHVSLFHDSVLGARDFYI
jgi:hypothetical protein